MVLVPELERSSLPIVVVVLFVERVVEPVVSMSSLLPPIVVPFPSELFVDPVVAPAGLSAPDVELFRLGGLSLQLPNSAQDNRPPATAIFKCVIFMFYVLELFINQDWPAESLFSNPVPGVTADSPRS